MPYNASGGPSINTGNAAWDQGLGSLSAGLFGDPSKIAQAGYYGAEQRKAQLQSAGLQEQLAAGHQFLGMTTGQMPGKPQYRTDPATGQNILADTAAVWGGPASAPPAASPPPAPISSAVVGPPPGPAPAPAAPPPGPVAGQVGANLGPAGLSSLVAQGGGAVSPPPGSAPPEAYAQAVVEAVHNTPGAPGPAVSPPAPGAPPAPNSTASDGSVPASTDHGVMHPATFTPSGGGVKGAPPAAPDGSPAPPMFNIGQFMALASLKGLPAADAMALGRGIVADWVKNGQMDSVTADRVVANIGEPSMRTTAIQGQTQRDVAGINAGSAATVANIQAGSASTVERMRNEEADRARGDELVKTEDNVLVPRRDLKPGQKGYDATLANTRLSAAVAPVTVQPEPGGRTFSETTETAQKNRDPLYQPVQETERGAADRQMAGINNAQVEVIDETSPTKTRVTTFADAKAKGLQLTPKGQDQFGAQVQSAIVNAKTPEARQQIIDASSAAVAANKPPDANEDYHRQQLFDNELTKAYPLPDKASYGTEMAVPGLDPEDENRIRNRADFLFNYSPDRSLHGNYSNAAARAIQEAKENGQLPTPEDLNAQRGQGGLRTIFGDVAGARPNVFTRTDLKGDQSDRFRVRPKKPGASDTKDQTAPAGAIAKAPAGAANGRKSINPPGVVRDGWVYPQ